MFATLLQDLRYGLRMLLAKPGFTLAAVLTLALGIGANTAVFSVIHALLLKPLPYADSESLVDVYNTYPHMNLINAGSSIPDYLDRRAQAPALADLSIYNQMSFNLAEQGAPQRLTGIVATPSLFSTLGASAALGRVLVDDDAKEGSNHVAVLSFTTWQNQFAGAADVIGRDVRMNGENYRVVGVMPAGFFFPNRDAQLWTAFAFTPAQISDDERGHEFSSTVGRLKPGATIAQLNAQMDAIVQRNVERLSKGPDGAGIKQFVETSGFTGRARSLRDQWVGDLRPMLWLLQTLVACVLLIACANVANLMLTRLSARQKELSVRAALGAGIFRIARQLLAESLLLSLAGGVVSLALAYAGVALIRNLGLGGQTGAFEISIDTPVLLFSLALAVLTGFLSGLLPVLSLARGRLVEALKDGGRGNSAGLASRALRSVLVVVQTAMAVALLVVAGLLIHSFIRVQQVDPGFSSENVLSASIALPKGRYPDNAKQTQFFERLLTEARALPGVKSAGLVDNMPFSGNAGSGNYLVEGHSAQGDEAAPHAFQQMVDEDFFKTLHIPVLQGRSFRDSDTDKSEKVAIIDELLAKKYFAGTNPIGKRISLNYSNTDPSKTQWLTVVGVVGTIRNRRLSQETTKETVYQYYRQTPDTFATLALRTALTPSALTAPLRAALARIDPEQPLFDIKTMTERVQISLDDRRTPMLLLLLFAGVALVLSAVGIYGVLAFAVAQRTGEVGVRMSLGAQHHDILRMVLFDGGRLAGIGLVVGLVVALGLGLMMRSQLFGVGVIDPLTLAIVISVIAATALLACWLPARRAAKVSPIVALRYE